MTPGSAPRRAADRVRTVFLGSGSFAVPIFEAVLAHPRIELVGVVTAPDRPAGRGKLLRPTPVALKARSTWAPLLQPARLRDEDAIAQVAELRPDLAILADYGQIVPQAVLDLPAHGMLNVHPSLLPRHRGATPIPATIAAADERAGVTVIRMDAGIDTGPIVAEEAWALDGTEATPALEAAAALRGAELLARTVGPWLDGSTEAVPQGEDGATLTRPFRRGDARLSPARPARELERQIRAQMGWPGTYLETDHGRILVRRASVAEAVDGDEPGTLVRHDRTLALTTADGRLVLDEAQLPGGRPMTGEELLRGHDELVGARATGTGSPVAAGATRQPAAAATE
jgi:methionyl-tRNA formyltransferase